MGGGGGGVIFAGEGDLGVVITVQVEMGRDQRYRAGNAGLIGGFFSPAD